MNLNMPFNNVKVDAYVGTSCGHMIMDAIIHAKTRIMIVSPYVDSDYLDTLAGKAKEGIYVKVVTCLDEEEKKALRWGRKKSILNQVLQLKKTNELRKKNLFKLRIGLYATWSFVFVLATLLILALSDSLSNLFRPFDIFSIRLFVKDHSLIFLGIAGLAVAAASFLGRVAARYRIFDYKYQYKYDFDLFLNPHVNELDGLLFVHSKIFLIDDVVYMGSLNFTKAGFVNNVETRFRTDNTEFVAYTLEILKELENRQIWANNERFARRHFREAAN